MSESSLLQMLEILPTGLQAKPNAQAKTKRSEPAPASKTFAAQGSIPADALSVEVDGFGILGAPMALAGAAELSRRGQPARFGQREKTLLDTTVRDTGEISAGMVHVQWTQDAWSALQTDIAQALGLECIDLHLHNLLVYGPGQFFKPHQDTEKRPRMVATLVLVWPSAHIGGELRVRLGGEEHRLVSQQLHGGSTIRWFAFYADCRHEIRPVEEGWRVALTFDLVVPEATQPLPASAVPPGLKAALARHFGLEGDERLTPWVLLLDHEYSQHGLRWNLLKGADRPRVGALRVAAQELGLTTNLALAELHQSWTAAPPDDYSRRRDRSAGPEPDELIDESLVLDFWVDEQGNVESRSGLSVDLSNVDSFTETGQPHLVDSEYEGYMGNYGETLDYWYRRAALVIQSPLAAVRTNFEVDFDAALADLLALAKQPHDLPTLAAHVKAGENALTHRIAHKGRTLLRSYAEIASALPDVSAALNLMHNFSPSTFTKQDAKALAHLEKSRGTGWMQALLKAWTDPQQSRRPWASWPMLNEAAEPALWPAAFDGVVQACRRAGSTDTWLVGWLQASLQSLVRFDKSLAKSTPAGQLALRDTHIQAVCQLATAIQCVPGCDEMLNSLLEHVVRHCDIYPLETLTPLVCIATQAASKTPAKSPLRKIVTRAIEQALAEPLRSVDDHRLAGVRWTCHCRDCAPVAQWAESPSGEPLVLPMAEPRRDHVQTQLRHASAPISAHILKQGSPYKLKLTKPDDMRHRDERQREHWSQDLERLRQLPIAAEE